MRLVGKIEDVRAVVDLLKRHHATQERRTGQRGDYEGIGGTDASRKFIEEYRVPVKLGVTAEFDERNSSGAIRIKDDNVGRVCARVPGLLPLLGVLEEQGDGH